MAFRELVMDVRMPGGRWAMGCSLVGLQWAVRLLSRGCSWVVWACRDSGQRVALCTGEGAIALERVRPVVARRLAVLRGADAAFR